MRCKSHQSQPLDKRTIQKLTLSLDLTLLPLYPPPFSYSQSNNHCKLSSTTRRRRRKEQSSEMAATMATSMAILNANCFNANTKNTNSSKPTKHLPLLSTTKPLTTTATTNNAAVAGTAIAGAIFSTLSTTNPAFAVQQLAEIADGDNRGLALLLPLVPAVLWVLYNILQPALNQINRMRSKGLVIGLGLGGLAASGFFHPPEASAAVAEAAADNRGQLLLFVISPALLWVAYNILQPALNQINRMRSD